MQQIEAELLTVLHSEDDVAAKFLAIKRLMKQALQTDLPKLIPGERTIKYFSVEGVTHFEQARQEMEQRIKTYLESL